jgi:hypothetical protein
MKCWECKQETSKAHRVFYVSFLQEKEKGRNVCPECYEKLQFNSCHYVEVEKITQKSLKN